VASGSTHDTSSDVDEKIETAALDGGAGSCTSGVADAGDVAVSLQPRALYALTRAT
jgi:hypothetical protein